VPRTVLYDNLKSALFLESRGGKFMRHGAGAEPADRARGSA
jgi:hypothetical protein